MTHGSGEHAIDCRDTDRCPPPFDVEGNEPETIPRMPAMVLIEDDPSGVADP